MKHSEIRAIPMKEAVELWIQHDPSVEDLTYEQLRGRLRRLAETGKISRFYLDNDGIFLYKNTDIIKLARANAEKNGEKQKNKPVTNCNQLPKWCQAGQWVYDKRNGYGEIKSVRDDRSACYIEFGGGAGDFVPEEFKNVLKQARLRPFKAEEIYVLPFGVRAKNSSFRTIVVSCDGENLWLGGASLAITTQELLKEFTFANGSPCGVKEHLEDGEWVE